MTKNGTVFTDRAMNRLQGMDYRFTKEEPFGIQLDIRKEDFYIPGAVMFRDGSSVLVNYGEPYEDPFTVDYDEAEDTFLLMDGDKLVDTVDFIPRPAFFDKVTSRGTHMDFIGGTCTGQRLLINGFQRCRFWEHGEQCHYCALFAADTTLEGEVNLTDIAETVREASREPGRFTEISVSGGSDFGGEPPFSVEVDRYIRVLNAVSGDVQGKIETQLQAPAYKKEDIRRIYENTCLTSYRPNIEVWDKASFERMCPGKTRWIGRDEWIRRMVDAVEVFGKGRVYTQMVCGAELAGPDGMKDVSRAIASATEGAEFLASNGVSCHEEIWRPHRLEKLGWQKMQELDYFIQLAERFHDIRKAHGICAVDTNFMRGSDNPDLDLERADFAEELPVQRSAVTSSMRREEYAAIPVPEQVKAFVSGKNVRVYAGVDEERAISLTSGLTVLEGKYLMLPMESDRSTLSSYLVKSLWFKSPVTLYVTDGTTTMKLQCRVYRNHIVGTKFRRMLDLVRESGAMQDMACTAELHLLRAETCTMPKLNIMDEGARYTHCHLG